MKYKIGKYKCLYCGYRCDDLNIVKKHEERLHGCFRDVNPRNPNGKNERVYGPKNEDDTKPSLYRQIPVKESDLTLDVFYYWDKDKGEFVFYTEDLKYGERVELVYDNDGILIIPNIDGLRGTKEEKQNEIFREFLEMRM